MNQALTTVDAVYFDGTEVSAQGLTAWVKDRIDPEPNKVGATPSERQLSMIYFEDTRALLGRAPGVHFDLDAGEVLIHQPGPGGPEFFVMSSSDFVDYTYWHMRCFD